MTTTRLKILLLSLIWPFVLNAQSIVDIINSTEKAVFEARAYNSARLQTGTVSGFLLSSDGLAITMGYIFEKADSAVVTLRSGKTFEVERIVSIHPPTNMALIKIEQNRQKTFNFLLPAKQSFKQNEELLFFTHPLESEDGMTLAPVNDLAFFPYLSRAGIISGEYNTRSAGAPAINNKGQLCGIINMSRNGMHKLLYNTYLLNDSNWVNINQPVKNNTFYKEKRDILNPLLSQSLLNITCQQYIEAAKNLSKYIRLYPEDDQAFCLRAYARYHYQNLVGSREDMDICQELNPHGFLQYYFKSLFDLAVEKDNEARINLELCLDNKVDFGPAICQLAKLNLENNNDVRTAFDWFTAAIDADSLLAEAYYERARLRLRHSSDEEATLEDIDKTIYLEPDLPGIYSIRGTIFFSKQDYLPAIRDFDLAIERDVKDVHAWFNRGVAHYNIGLHQKACYDWDKAGKLGNYEAFKYISRYCKNVKRNVYGR
ncbi:trypsin-like peptidase domain-containing protein [Carboxylicivirga sediminis]|uniref:Trypsin-like peptidase domain-containing protein n=1 Tax=Carboxylicivirga sediminis TaxID=2006564 RepID=A0A941F620_9BACT|nr:serine protease [Carboxylicivirga sediminis]MBR8537032.1 trypsin-like peptidase domain-containing protein [Carboxylicivirga sediminis]